MPSYAKVKYAGVYPGVDVVYYGNQGGQLEYEFVVAPGADPSCILLAVGLSRRFRVVRAPPSQFERRKLIQDLEAGSGNPGVSEHFYLAFGADWFISRPGVKPEGG